MTGAPGLKARIAAIKARLADAYPDANDFGYSQFGVGAQQRGKNNPRGISITWALYPLEADVQAALGDLHADDVTYYRHQIWACGRNHADAEDAWKAHEGSDYLTFEDDYLGGEYVLTDEGRDQALADGHDFTSTCRQGNYVACPECHGRTTILDPRTRPLTVTPCGLCADLGIDRATGDEFPGILNLDTPAHLAAYQAIWDAVMTKRRTARSRAAATATAAAEEPTTWATPTWRKMPTRAAGRLNGYPVTDRPRCDYLTDADNPNRRVLCDNKATWFDPTTALRVCTRHKNQGPDPRPSAENAT